MLCMLIAYDAAGAVVATLDFMAARDEQGEVIGLIDFAAHEAAGGKFRDIWVNDQAIGSGTWPEWLGIQAHAFDVDLDAEKRIVALVHRASGRRRERAAVEEAIALRIAAAGDEPADLRDLVGGPGAPLVLDEQGATVGRSPQPYGTPAQLPIIHRQGGH
jgi:hypothetical protein